MSKNNQERVKKYQALREVGFTSREANLLKERTWDKINTYIAFQQDYLNKRNALLTKDGRGKQW